MKYGIVVITVIYILGIFCGITIEHIRNTGSQQIPQLVEGNCYMYLDVGRQFKVIKKYPYDTYSITLNVFGVLYERAVLTPTSTSKFRQIACEAYN